MSPIPFALNQALIETRKLKDATRAYQTERILKRIAEGMSDKEVAQSVGVPPQRVKQVREGKL